MGIEDLHEIWSEDRRPGTRHVDFSLLKGFLGEKVQRHEDLFKKKQRSTLSKPQPSIKKTHLTCYLIFRLMFKRNHENMWKTINRKYTHPSLELPSSLRTSRYVISKTIKKKKNFPPGSRFFRKLPPSLGHKSNSNPNPNTWRRVFGWVGGMSTPYQETEGSHGIPHQSGKSSENHRCKSAAFW